MKYAAIVIAPLMFFIGSLGAQSSDEKVIVPIESLCRGDFATIRGEVVRYRGYDEIIVRDESGRVEIFLGSTRFPRPPVEVGEMVTISGRVDDGLIDIRRELYATEIVRADGTVISIDAPVEDAW
ncbi:MAG: hypothetical protein MI724_04815 [Spirochaetales bacterium]|nr:hypothetical protein [Spirochaetales bacterium]